jgi:hypothetical protein
VAAHRLDQLHVPPGGLLDSNRRQIHVRVRLRHRQRPARLGGRRRRRHRRRRVVQHRGLRVRVLRVQQACNPVGCCCPVRLHLVGLEHEERHPGEWRELLAEEWDGRDGPDAVYLSDLYQWQGCVEVGLEAIIRWIMDRGWPLLYMTQPAMIGDVIIDVDCITSPRGNVERYNMPQDCYCLRHCGENGR